METKKWIALLVIVALVAGTIGYVVKPAPPEMAELEAKISGLDAQVAEQSARIKELEAIPKARPIKAGFIYVGPVGDVGWTAAHDRGRLIVDEKYDWLETFYEEAVAEADVPDAIDAMFKKGADVVFTTSFGYGWETVKAGTRWPDKTLYHCSGDPSIHGSAPNVGFYFADFHEIYYLNGLMAGALTKTNKIGYIAAFPISELVRHWNSFYLGAKEVNEDVEMKVIVMGTAWYDPETTKVAFATLAEWGADVVAHTEDSPATIAAAQDLYKKTGKRVWTFSHYTPMKEFGPDVVLSGQLVHWERWYELLLLKAQQGEKENWQHWGLMAGEYVEMGTTWGEPIRPDVIPELKAYMVEDPVLGRISVYDLIQKRIEQFKDMPASFHPFTGPIYDTEGNLRVKPGEIIRAYELNWTIDWSVKGIIPPE